MSIQITSFLETKEIGKRVSTLLNSEFNEISVSYFPDEESLVKLNKNPKGKTLIIISSLAKNPDKKIIETILAAGAARDNGANKVILFATYLPYMRQDKIFNNYEGISATSMLRTLSQHFDKVFAIDPHLHRIKSLQEISKNCFEISSINLIVASPNSEAVLLLAKTPPI